MTAKGVSATGNAAELPDSFSAKGELTEEQAACACDPDQPCDCGDAEVFFMEVVPIEGDDENVEVAAEAIKIIEAEARSANLTDRVREFIEKKLPQSEEEEDIEEESE